MPRLPTAEDLGVPSNYNSGRQIASYDVTAIGRGAEKGAEGIMRAGNAIASAGAGLYEKEKYEGRTLEDAQARADLLTANAKRRSEISDATDAEKLQETHAAGAQADLEAAANRIQDPTRRALFLESNRPTVTGTELVAKDRAFKLQTDTKKAAAFEQLNTLKQTAIEDSDEAKKGEYIKTGQDIITGLEKEGYITAEEGARQRKSWGESYAVSAIEKMSPVARLAAVRGGWEGALIQKESSGNPRVVNSLGYTGLYQMGAPLLTTLGMYKPGANENLQTWSTDPKGAPGKWSGTFTIPGFPGVKTLDDFRESPEAQRATFLQSQTYYDGQIQSRGLDKFIGTTVQGVPITREGIYSMMHLGGAKGAENALKNGANAKDANGSGVLDYARMAAKAGPGVATFLSPEQKTRVADGATRELVQQDRKAQQAQANEAATVKSLLRDDEGSIITSGKPVAELTPERVESALGPAAAEAFTINRAQATRYHQETADWDQIPLEEIRARLGTLKPEDGVKGFDSGQKYFSQAEKQADAIRKERQADPAAAADKMLGVDQDKQGATLDMPESYQPILKARRIAFDQLKIPEDARLNLTRTEAQTLWRPIDLARKGGDARELKETLQATIEQLKTAFGGDEEAATQAWQQVLREGHADKETAAVAGSILKKLARNEVPTREDMRAMDEAQKNAGADRATSSVLEQLGLGTLDEYGQPIDTTPKPKTFPTPDPEAIKMLKGKPELGPMFDETYGPGTAAKILAITAGKAPAPERPRP
ncbi:hypothetical protein [uncultured Methylobacterium sp.]|uniref:hypothetical protein n=1 Tax=uncultured Methylobacterium sp. TaxID=157278 RepID=UPI0035CC7D28